jgi:hypothetical protein
MSFSVDAWLNDFAADTDNRASSKLGVLVGQPPEYHASYRLWRL